MEANPEETKHSKFEYSGFPGGSVVKNPSANAGDTDSIHDPGRSPGGGNGNPLQYSCLGNPMDKGAWWATAQVVTGLDMTEPVRVVDAVQLSSNVRLCETP